MLVTHTHHSVLTTAFYRHSALIYQETRTRPHHFTILHLSLTNKINLQIILALDTNCVHGEFECFPSSVEKHLRGTFYWQVSMKPANHRFSLLVIHNPSFLRVIKEMLNLRVGIFIFHSQELKRFKEGELLALILISMTHSASTDHL